MAAQADLCLAWSEIPEDTFSHGVAHVYHANSVSSTPSSVLILVIIRRNHSNDRSSQEVLQ